MRTVCKPLHFALRSQAALCARARRSAEANHREEPGMKAMNPIHNRCVRYLAELNLGTLPAQIAISMLPPQGGAARTPSCLALRSVHCPSIRLSLGVPFGL